MTRAKVSSGAGTFVKVDYFQKMGFVDDSSFPHYAADIDFTLGAHEAGYTIIFEPKAVIYKKMTEDGTLTHQLHSILTKLIFHYSQELLCPTSDNSKKFK